MWEQLEQCLSDFFKGWEVLEPDGKKRSKLILKEIDFDFKYNPHERPRPLEPNQRAIYIFFKADQWLRIGQTDYSARFTSQHYGTKRAKSTLAKDIRDHGSEFGFDGTEEQIGNWILLNCGRANLRLPAQGVEPKACESFAKLLESYFTTDSIRGSKAVEGGGNPRRERRQAVNRQECGAMPLYRA